MNLLFETDLSGGGLVLLIACLVLAFAFEFVNGFHDTANAVATVIYTNSLPPRVAVVLSGICNFLGVLVGGIAVAMAIMKLLPVELLVGSGPGSGLAMVLALLLAAITWNLGTWYFGLPASSSHTLIGSIIGVGLANSLTAGHYFGEGVNWLKARDIGLSLLISPLAGFTAAALLYTVLKRFDRKLAGDPTRSLPAANQPPPPATRAVLIGTCSAVSFAHGSNDGQKGVGLVMLILIGLVPAGFALDHSKSTTAPRAAIVEIDRMLATRATPAGAKPVAAARAKLADLEQRMGDGDSVADIAKLDRFPVRADILVVDKALGKLVANHHVELSADEAARLSADRKQLRGMTDYAPIWVLFAIAIALGFGTMVGWRRIVVTVGEKIGKSHLTYGQGMSAEIVAATAIGIASASGLPVSTTHVLSSGVAGTMVAQRTGVNPKTIRSIALAWLLTLPACTVLAGVLFLILRLALG